MATQRVAGECSHGLFISVAHWSCNCECSYMSCAETSHIHFCAQYRAKAVVALMFSLAGCTEIIPHVRALYVWIFCLAECWISRVIILIGISYVAATGYGICPQPQGMHDTPLLDMAAIKSRLSSDNLSVFLARSKNQLLLWHIQLPQLNACACRETKPYQAMRPIWLPCNQNQMQTTRTRALSTLAPSPWWNWAQRCKWHMLNAMQCNAMPTGPRTTCYAMAMMWSWYYISFTMQSLFVGAKRNALHFGHVNCRYTYMSCAYISSIHLCSQFKSEAAVGLMFSMVGCIGTCVSIFWYSLTYVLLWWMLWLYQLLIMWELVVSLIFWVARQPCTVQCISLGNFALLCCKQHHPHLLWGGSVVHDAWSMRLDDTNVLAWTMATASGTFPRTIHLRPFKMCRKATQCIAGECIFGSQLFVLVLAGISYRHMLSFMLPCSICAHVCYGVMLLYNNTMQSSFVSAKHNGLHLHFGHVNCRYSRMSCAYISSIHRCSQYKATAAMGLMFSMMGCIGTCVSIFWYSLYCCDECCGCTSYWSCENLCLA